MKVLSGGNKKGGKRKVAVVANIFLLVSFEKVFFFFLLEAAGKKPEHSEAHRVTIYNAGKSLKQVTVGDLGNRRAQSRRLQGRKTLAETGRKLVLGLFSFNL